MELLKKTFVTFLPTCRQAVRLQSDALDHPLPVMKRLGLSFHLLICKWCRLYGEQIRFVKSTAAGGADKVTEAVPQTLSAETRERIKQRLRDS